MSLARRRRGPHDARSRKGTLARVPRRSFALRFEHVRREASRLGVRMVTCAGRDDGLASRDVPVVAVPPISNRFAIATALHELGHKANPCQPGHRRKPSKSGSSSCCVRCESMHGRGLAQHVYAGIWWPEQQEDLRRGLGSYRSYATPAERVEMDKLINAEPTPFAAQRLRLLEKMK